MPLLKVYADFQNLDDHNRLRLTCVGTLEDLKRQGLQLREGLVLTFTMDDADEKGHPDELLLDGVVQYSQEEQAWVASVNWSALRHASEDIEQNRNALDGSNAPGEAASARRSIGETSGHS